MIKVSRREKEDRFTKSLVLFAIAIAMLQTFAAGSGYAANINHRTFAIAVAVLPVLAGSQESTPSTNQRSFASPDDAFAKLIVAVRTGDSRKLAAIFGPGSKDIFSADQTDEKKRARFVQAYEEKHRLETVGRNKIILHVGKNDWTWPVPIVKNGNRWRFDTAAGKKEIVARRIGRNEVAAVQVCLAYVDAQLEYAKKHTAHGLPEYAQKMISDPGTENGLLWESANGERQGLLGPLVAAACKTNRKKIRFDIEYKPYHGYFYKILKRQGKDAEDGAYDYVVDGKMIGGFALVAYPAQYGSSGITTFIVNQQGIVYQKDMGTNTQKIAEAMTGFHPDPTWKKVD